MGDQTCRTLRGFNKYAEFWWEISLESEHLPSMGGDRRTKHKGRIKLMESESAA